MPQESSYKRKLDDVVVSSSKKPKPNLSLTALKKLMQDDVLQLLWDELPVTPVASQSFLKAVQKTKVNDEYPPDTLSGLDLYTAVTQYIESSSKDQAKLSIIDNLIKSNKITDHHWAVTITDWLINTFVNETSTKLPPLPSSVAEFYDQCYTKYLANNTIVPPTISIDALNECISDCKIEIGIIEKKKYTNEIELPSFYKYPRNELAFHLFPYLPNLQVSEENDNIIVNNIEKSKLPVIIISPSGMGKTGLIIRSLSKYPGIYICAAHEAEFLLPIAQDMASVTFLTKISKTEDRFATIRQLCQLLLITKMLHILEILKNVTQEQINSFQGSLLSLLSFNQFNGKTDIEAKIFDILISKQYHYCQIEKLRDISKSLIETILVKLKDFNINSEKFIICVDEANLFEASYQRFFSINGRDRGILSALATEISYINTLVRSSTSIFAGTSFDVDISSVIRSGMGKTELTADCMKLYNFQYLDIKQFIDFMLVHNVKYSIDQLNECKKWFPMRRRQALYFLHMMLDNNNMLDNQSKIQAEFENSEHKMKEYIQQKCMSFEERMTTSKDVYLQSFKIVLMKYIIHFRFPELLGSTFIVQDGQVAKNLLMSGITCPSSENELHFYAIDRLGYDFCVQYLNKMNFPFSDSSQIISSQLLTFSDREEILEPVIGIALTSLDLTLKGLIESTKYKLQQNVTPILDCKVKCKRLFNSSSFYLYCKDNNWIDDSIGHYSGEQLFFHFIGKEDYQKIDEMALFPSDHNHTDIYLFYLANNVPVHFRISVKSLTGKDLEIDKGYKSLAPELMYLDRYKDVELETLNLLRKKETSLDTVSNFIKESVKGNVKQAEQELKNLTKSSSNEEMEGISNINENENDEVESTTDELESVTELDNEYDIMVKNIKKSINNKLDDWWRSNRKQVWSSIQKGVSLNVIIHLHPNKEPKRLSNCYSNIICIGKKSFSTLFPYLSNNVETFLQNQLNTIAKKKNMQN